MIKYLIVFIGIIAISSFLYFEKFNEKHQSTEPIQTVENLYTKEIEIQNKKLLKENLSRDEAKLLENKDISDLNNEYTDIELTDAIDVPYDIPVSDFMLELIPHKELELYNVNTQEKLEAVFWVAGDYVPEALGELNQFMRDWRRNQVIDIDPDLYKLLHDLYNEVDAEKPIHLISGHRSEHTNNSLRAQGRNTARKASMFWVKPQISQFPVSPLKNYVKRHLKWKEGALDITPTIILYMLIQDASDNGVNKLALGKQFIALGFQYLV